MGKVANELNKLIIAVKNTNKITADHIEKNIGLSKEYNLLELQNALASKNVFKANQIIQYFGANPIPIRFKEQFQHLFGYFSNMFAYHFLKDKSEHNVAAELTNTSVCCKKTIYLLQKNILLPNCTKLLGFCVNTI